MANPQAPVSQPAWRLRLAAARYRFRESLFYLPALIVLGGILLAEAAAAVDRAIHGEALPFTLTMNSNAATWLLSTVAGEASAESSSWFTKRPLSPQA